MINFAKEKKLDAVLGTRFRSNQDKEDIPFFKKIVLRLARQYERTFYSIKLTDAHNGLRVLSRQACESLNYLDASGMAHATEIPSRLCKAGYDLNEFPCKVNYTLDKDSTTLISSLNIISDLLQRK